MAENEGREGKDLALDQKKEFEKRILEAIEDLKTGQTTVSTEGIEVTNYGEQYTIKLKGITFGIIDKEGKFTYNRENFKEVKEALKEDGLTLEDLGLPNLEQSIDQEKEPDEKEPEHNKDEEKENPEPEKDDEEQEKDIEKDKEEIAEELGIEPKKIYPIREDSAFYKNHPGMFPGKDLFFFEDKQGNIKVGTKDENGRAIEDTVHFSSKQIGQMEQVIRLGDGREDVRKDIPLQTIAIENPAKGTVDKDVRDRYIAVFRGNGGYLEFEEVEQSREKGKPAVSERIEVSGREYNTHEMNERTENRRGGQTPGETVENYESLEESSKADDGIQPNEVDKETFKKQIAQDLTKTYGPMPADRLEAMTEDVMERIKAGEKRDEAIARVGIEERETGGRTQGEPRDNRGH